MHAATRTTGKTLWVAIRAILACTLVLGVGYTALITGIGQLILPAQANGSKVTTQGGETVGSALIGQAFVDSAGDPLPQYFQPRPSAAGDGYNAGASSGSNWGPENEELIAAIAERQDQISKRDGVDVKQIPADAVTASSSGLDPHISPEYARLQVARVATARELPVERVQALVAAHTEAPDLGFLGEPRINVLQINLELDELEG